MKNINVSKKLSVPWNQASDFRTKILKKYEDYITEIYFAPPLEYKQRKFKEHYKELKDTEFRKELKEIKDKFPNIELNMIFNSMCEVEYLDEENINKLVKSIKTFENISSLTVANLYLAEKFMELLPEKKIHLSVRMDIDNFEKVSSLVEKYEERIYCINLGRNSVYDLELFKKLKKHYPNIKYKIILNEFCTQQCMDSNLHSLMKAHNKYCGVERLYCESYTEKNFWRFFTGKGILPRDISKWNNSIDIYKISGRWLSTDKIDKIIEAYVYQKDVTIGTVINDIAQGGSRFKNNKLLYNKIDTDKVYPKEFTEIRLNCKGNCESCGYCKKIGKEFLRESIG